ncbi:MAG: HlyD family efflux transporter periplasmic adaptor subunit [Planctomycetes bacterium]|nr:HlyD family efflux transporter periplasmic adaptor subunit [Planctomycetota bacterium]
MKKFLIFILLPAALLFGAYRIFNPEDDSDDGPQMVTVQRGSISVDAVAVGRVEALFEVPVKSTAGGVLTRRFVALGQHVKKGQPIGEVRPVLTDLQRLRAERALLGAKESEEGVVEMRQGQNLAGWALRMLQGGNSLDRMQRGVARARSDAEEQLELLLNGEALIDGKVIDYLVRAPIEGHVIVLDLEQGEPVVPSSSFGSGTELCVLADMDHPIFRGTVDEIDVGRLVEGMAAEIVIGARPDEVLHGKLTQIALKAQNVNNAVQFEVRIAVQPPENLVLRSGYSAVARIRLQQAQDVMILPERVVDFRAGKAYIIQFDEMGQPQEMEIQVGLSDGMSVEIVSGVEVGDFVAERN